MNIPKGPHAAPGRPCTRTTRSGPAAAVARVLWPALPAILLALAAAGCGQRGPLYLPDDRTGDRTAERPAGQTAEAEEEEQSTDPNLEDDDEETPGA